MTVLAEREFALPADSIARGDRASALGRGVLVWLSRGIGCSLAGRGELARHLDALRSRLGGLPP